MDDQLTGDIFCEAPYPDGGRHHQIITGSCGFTVMRYDLEDEPTVTFGSRDEARDHIRSTVERECQHLGPENSKHDLSPENYLKVRENQACSRVAKNSRRGLGNRREGNIVAYVGNGQVDAGIYLYHRGEEYVVYFAEGWEKYYCNIE